MHEGANSPATLAVQGFLGASLDTPGEGIEGRAAWKNALAVNLMLNVPETAI